MRNGLPALRPARGVGSLLPSARRGCARRGGRRERRGRPTVPIGCRVQLPLLGAWVPTLRRARRGPSVRRGGVPQARSRPAVPGRPMLLRGRELPELPASMRLARRPLGGPGEPARPPRARRAHRRRPARAARGGGPRRDAPRARVRGATWQLADEPPRSSTGSLNRSRRSDSCRGRPDIGEPGGRGSADHLSATTSRSPAIVTLSPVASESAVSSVERRTFSRVIVTRGRVAAW